MAAIGVPRLARPQIVFCLELRGEAKEQVVLIANTCKH